MGGPVTNVAIRTPRGWREPCMAVDVHRLVQLFAQRRLRLTAEFEEMLSDAPQHRTERRGCGYAQITRALASHVNRPRGPEDRRLVEDIDGDDCWDLSRLDGLTELARPSEQRLLVRMLIDLLAPHPQCNAGLFAPRVFTSEHRVGSCPQAEEYFLEIAGRFLRRGGSVRVLTSPAGHPVMIEKCGLGDAGSAISVATVSVNGVRIPPGGLFAIRYDVHPTGPLNRQLPGRVLPIQAASVRFMRLTTLAVPPNRRHQAFTVQFEHQLAQGWFRCAKATVADLVTVAAEQVRKPRPAPLIARSGTQPALPRT